MKKSIIGLIIVVVALGTFGVWYSYHRQTQEREAPASSTTVHVAATIYPLYDIVRTVGGPQVRTELVLPVGASPHTFSFSPRDVAKLQDVSLIFAIGNGLDDWISNATAANPDIQTVIVDQGITLEPFTEPLHDEGETEEEDEHDEGPYDPHYYLSLKNAGRIAHTVADVLGDRDPAHRDLYAQRAQQYEQEALALQKDLTQKMAPFAGSAIVTLHDAWAYFADEFGLRLVASFEPHAGEEPTPRYLARIGDIVRKENVRVIFAEPQLSSAALQSFAQDNGLTIAMLDPEGGVDGHDTFFAQMRYNVDAIASALQAYEK